MFIPCVQSLFHLVQSRSAGDRFSHFCQEGSFFCFHFQSNIFCIKNSKLMMFLFACLFAFNTCLLAYFLSDEKLVIILISVPLYAMYLFFSPLTAFKIFSLSLVLRIWLWHIFLHFVLKTLWISCICGFKEFINSGNFQLLFL